MSELKPCPFCGSAVISKKHSNRFVDWWLVFCPVCHVSQTGSQYGFEFESIEAWNRRVGDMSG